jgi:hypothetical protein
VSDVNPFSGLTSSRGLNRALPWIAGAVLLLGVLAFWQTTVRTNENKETFSNERVRNDSAAETVPLAPEAREVVVKFIRTAVMRKDLAEAWKISGPQLRQDLTLRQWLSGNIPVVPYPDAAVNRSPVKITWSHPTEAGLEVVLQPAPGSKEKPQLFFVGVLKQGSGSQAKWVVDYWAPYAPPPIPTDGGTGG